MLSASRLIPSSIYSIPLTLPPPRFDALAFAMPYTTHALTPPRRDFVAHSASALPGPCSRPPANVVLRPRQWSGSPLMQPPPIASLLAHRPHCPRLPPTSHTTFLATTSIRLCTSEACMPSPRCSRPAARLSRPSPAPDAVLPARVATTQMAARLTYYATAVMSKSPHLPATVFPAPDYDHPRHATPRLRAHQTRPAPLTPCAASASASLVAHVVPHPQCLLPIPHDPVFTFSSATTHALFVSSPRPATIFRAGSLSPLDACTQTIPTMPYTTTGVPSRADDRSPSHTPPICSSRLQSLTPPSSPPRRPHLRVPPSTVATALSATAAPRVGSVRHAAGDVQPQLASTALGDLKDAGVRLFLRSRHRSCMDSTVGSPMASSLIPSDDADSPTNIDAFLYLLTQTLSLFSD
ncbi:hypothetical protein B0H13DRAFT_2542414 [Mycena leptocephala]|nr:hypothetical protein B0H13DRAFT_2542414 [Mycena leptocephala]